MAKIVSRPGTEDTLLADLQKILVHHSMGVINHASESPQVQVGSTIDTCLDQVDQMFVGARHATIKMTMIIEALTEELSITAMALDASQDLLANLVEDIGYDDALNHATLDLMDAFQSSGAADCTPDGDLAFDGRVTFSKEDLKPMVRQAILRWVEQRMAL